MLELSLALTPTLALTLTRWARCSSYASRMRGASRACCTESGTRRSGLGAGAGAGVGAGVGVGVGLKVGVGAG